MKRSKPTTLPLGTTISEGTLRPEDLIPAYLDALEGLRLSKAERNHVYRIERRMEARNEDDGYEIMDEDIETLTEILESHCPDYAYFGSLDGDVACFGVWPDLEGINQNVQKVDELPSIWNGGKDDPYHVAVVSDHDNVTLYRRSGNRWIEVWSIV
jgi:hypothetical protein